MGTRTIMAMKKAMKATMKAMKKKSMKKAMKSSMKRRKAKKVSKIARGRNRKSQVWTGRKEKTGGGLKKSDFIKNKNKKIVSKRKSALGQKSKFIKAVIAARKALGIRGFQAVGGKSAKGQALLKKARSLYRK